MTDVLVVGGGISGLVTAYRLRQRGLSVRLLEAEPRTGGTIGTVRKDGFELETGPNGVLDSRREAMELIAELGLRSRLRPASSAARRRYLVHRGRLEPVPRSPRDLVTTRLLSWSGRLRALAEPLVSSRPDPNETVDAFVRRRLGAEVAERLVDPVVSGIFAGDSTRLSLAAAFPSLYALEEQGGLVRGLLAKRRARAADAGSKPARGFGHLTALAGGMQTLTDTLTERLGDGVRSGQRAVTLAYGQGRWTIETAVESGRLEAHDAPAVVLALPSWAAASLVAPLTEPLAALLRAIPYAPIAVVSLGFRVAEVAHPLDGFGFLAASVEKRDLLGCVFTSTVFPGTAPEGCVLLRNMVGGWRQPELAGLANAELVERVVGELRPLLGVRGTPVLEDVVRWPRGIPQYHVGHLDRLAALDTALARWPGLHLTGNAYRGVGLNDCIVDGARVADRVAGELLGS